MDVNVSKEEGMLDAVDLFSAAIDRARQSSQKRAAKGVCGKLPKSHSAPARFM